MKEMSAMFSSCSYGSSTGYGLRRPQGEWALVLMACSVLCTVLFGSATGVFAEAPKSDLFVAADGNDAWSGTLSEPNAEKSDGPFATISRARDAVRALKAKGPLTQPVTVMVREGTYYLDDTLVFGPQDSGTRECPVSYGAYPGEAPVISGGRAITADWRPYRGKIQVCVIPEIKQGKWYFRGLSVDGKRRKRSLPAESDSNIMFSTIGCVLNDPIIKGLPGVQSFADWKKRGLDANSITADPLFVDLENDDFSLKPDSPAFKVGFKPIDLSKVGLRGRDRK
jgi:hypothetical protein